MPTVSPEGVQCLPQFLQATCRTKKMTRVAIQVFKKVVVAKETSFSMMA
jgi:hypothetical protein